MPKLKTNRAANKRFRLTGTGRVARQPAGARHKFLAKSSARKRRVRGLTLLSRADEGRALRLLGKR